MDALRQAIERIAEGTPLRDEAEAEMNIILRLVKDAQIQLRSTQINWQEDCLFKCDAALTELVTQIERVGLDSLGCALEAPAFRRGE